ncbi:hypothetical protein PsYK624_013830 [Phanerochaete sordida]|uniref:Uncharacterized protein n=1 Tax=Phanerochaete sordida TaxID=48140 RepID=A0A9P3FZS5_9APHY|nr:hypothetical protein PsYK624_013830 [Phanerochaete sordida]
MSLPTRSTSVTSMRMCSPVDGSSSSSETPSIFGRAQDDAAEDSDTRDHSFSLDNEDDVALNMDALDEDDENVFNDDD